MKLIKLNGGLGNQMFQYAFAKAVGDKFTFLYGDYKKHGHRKFELKYLKCKILYIPRSIFKHISFLFEGFKKVEYLNSGVFKGDYLSQTYKDTNCIYIGYFQSEKYFKHIRPQLVKDFQSKRPPDKKNLEILKDIQNSNSISIHIRRTDYIITSNINIYGETDLNYYKNAINYISKNIENPKFFFFSDDMDYVKENFSDLEYEHVFVEINKGRKSYKDMQLMKNCKHNIIPNSTFAWWAAWLNENPDKIVIAPKIWFHDNPERSRDTVPEEWIRL